MLTTVFNGIQYVFEEDRLSLNGIPLLYSEITNIAHRGGAQPAFIFDYKGRRYVLPYEPAEFQSILPYFVRAKNMTAAPAAVQAPPVEPAPVQPAPQEYVEPAPQEYVEPAPVEYVEPATIEEPAPVEYVEPEPYVQEAEIYEPAPQADPIQQEYIEPAPIEEPAAEEYIDPAPIEEPAAEEYIEPAAQEYTETATEEALDLDPASEETLSLEDALMPDDSLASEETKLTSLPQDPPPKKKPPIVKIVIGAVILAALIAAAVIFLGGKDEDSASEDMSASDFATEEEIDEDFVDTEESAPTGGTFEATDGFTVTDPDGSMDIKLTKVYTDDEAFNKIKELGEDENNFSDAKEPGYRLVFYEYEVNVKNGAMVGDTITGEMFQSDQKTEFDDWWPIDLMNNVDKDLSAGEINIPSGETSTVYIAYAMPEDLKDYYEKVLIDEDGTEIWVHYVISK